MTDITPAEMRTRIAAEFDRRSWQYEPGLGDQLLAGLAPGSELDPGILARRVPADYLVRTGIERDQVAAALAGLGGLTLVAAPTKQTVVVNDNRYQVNVSGNGSIVDSDLNLGGTQINISASAPKEDVLAGLRVLLAAAFSGDWNEAALVEIAGLIDARDDIGVEDVRALTVDVGADEKAEPGRIRSLLEKVATGTLTGALTTGLSAGLGHLLANPPF
jgi:hypothetical protein